MAILIRGLSRTGGISEVWRIADQGSRIDFYNSSTDLFERHTFWNLVFGSVVLWGSPYATSQFLIHRCLCLKDLRSGKITLYVNFVGQIVIFGLVSSIGLVLYAYFSECDPYLVGAVSNRDAIVPAFVVLELSDLYGVPGRTFEKFTDDSSLTLV